MRTMHRLIDAFTHSLTDALMPIADSYDLGYTSVDLRNTVSQLEHVVISVVRKLPIPKLFVG